MLDKLVESNKNNKESRKLKGLLFVTSSIAFSGVIFALIFSLFSENLAMGNNEFDLSSLITPPKIAKEEPIKPKPEKIKKKLANSESKVITRKQNIMRLDETPQKVPNAISTKPSENMARPNSDFEIGTIDKTPVSFSSENSDSDTISKGVGDGFQKSEPKPIKKEIEEPKKLQKPIQKIPPPPKPVVKKKTVVSGGVVNGKAQKLVKPVYPQAAKMAQIRGRVTVQVLIDENGKVISAKASNGHPLLRNHAVAAAKRSTFTPTLLSGEKVKVSGMIVYSFN